MLSFKKSKDNNFASFDFGIDETLLKVFIAFEVGTMNFYNNSIFTKIWEIIIEIIISRNK